MCIRVRSTHTYFIIFKWLASGQKKSVYIRASIGKSWQEDILETWWTKWWWWFSCRIVNVNIFSPGFQKRNVKIPTIYHVWHKNQSKTRTHPIKWSDFDKRNCFGFVGDFNTKRMLCLHIYAIANACQIDKCSSGPHSAHIHSFIFANHAQQFMLNLIYIVDPVFGQISDLIGNAIGKKKYMALRNNTQMQAASHIKYAVVGDCKTIYFNETDRRLFLR